MRPLNSSQTTIALDPSDQIRCSFKDGKLPMMCTPTISNILVTKTLIDNGAWLNVLLVATFEKLQLPYEQLTLTKPFSGVTEGPPYPIGKCLCPVPSASGRTTTLRSSSTTSHTSTCHTTILGYLALAKFMEVVHHGYNVVKMPGHGGVITIPCHEKDAISALERVYRTAAAERSDDEDNELPREDLRKKKKELLPMECLGVSCSVLRDGALPTIT
ncbi:hypothetical protein ZWY2020_051024 [Hordeum vulgare]|nr:hypothetical protein ZWY2020_051024 [Hordeum vulgare]